MSLLIEDRALIDIGSNPVPRNGLLVEWLFGGNANDTSGGNNHGIINNASFTTDRKGKTNKAVSFNGTNSYIDFTSTILLSSIKTVSIWVKADLLSTRSPILTGINSLSTEVRLGFYTIVSGFPTVWMGENNLKLFNDPSGFHNDNNWHHWVFIITGVGTNDVINSKIYVDGSLLAVNGTLTLGPVQLNRISHMGREFQSGNNFHFKGSLDDMRIYDIQLSDSEILQLRDE